MIELQLKDRHGNAGKLKRVRGILLSLLLPVSVVYSLYFIPVPFYIYKPGTAEPLKPMVRVTNGDPEEKGAFMLTTVTMGRSNAASFLLARFNPNAEIRKKADVLRGRTEEEYSARQQYVMLDSQSSAIQAAYRRANISYQIESTGVFVMQTFEGYPAHDVLRPGDQIVKIGEKPVLTHRQILDELKPRKAGESVEVTIKREHAEKKVTLTLKELNASAAGGQEQAGDAPRAGFGISIAEMLEIRPEQEDKRVKIDAGEIGGPSAGLMFALEIYNQLTPDDLTKGYRIAGTGTIDPAGNVCSIGGIRQKIVAADREKADIFFAPVDRKAGECGLAADVPNASDAIDQANKIKTHMKVIPVATLEEAIRYLDTLPPKAS